MINIRREEVGGNSPVVTTAGAEGAKEAENSKNTALTQLLLLREIAKNLPNKADSATTSDQTETEFQLFPTITSEEYEALDEAMMEEEGMTLRSALAGMILSIEQTTVELAKVHSTRTDHSVEMSKRNLDEIDKQWEKMLKQFRKADKASGIMKKIFGSSKAFNWIAGVSMALMAGVTMGVGTGVMMATMVALEESGAMDKLVDTIANETGIPASVVNLAVIAAVASAGGMVGGVSGAGAGKVAFMAGSQAAIAGGGVATPFILDIAKALGANKTELMWVEMSFGMVEALALMFAAGKVMYEPSNTAKAAQTGARAAKTANTAQTQVEMVNLGAPVATTTTKAAKVTSETGRRMQFLIDLALVGGVIGGVGQAATSMAAGATSLDIANIKMRTGEIEANIELLTSAMRLNDSTYKSQVSHNKSMTHAKEAMTQSYGLIAAAWKSMANILR